MKNNRFRSLACYFLVKVLWEKLALESWILTFGESLVENDCFGSLHVTFGESRWKMLLVEDRTVTFRESLLKNAGFASLNCRFSVKVSWKMFESFKEESIKSVKQSV